MSLSFTELKDQARFRADMVNSTFISDVELGTYVNQSARELYDLLVSTYEDYYIESSSVQITSGNMLILPPEVYKVRGLDINVNGSWQRLRRAVFIERNNFSPLPARLSGSPWADTRYTIMANKLYFWPESNPPIGQEMRLWYVPVMPTLEAGRPTTGSLQNISIIGRENSTTYNGWTFNYANTATAGSETITIAGSTITVGIQSGVSTALQVATAINDSLALSDILYANIIGVDTTPQTTPATTTLGGGVDDDRFDGINGWEEYVVVDAAIKCLIKEESDISALMAQKMALKTRIEQMADDRDVGEQEYVGRTRTGTTLWGRWW